ncbi:hypothetical protein GQ43DRAFT_369123, partial [Delitschia confertaspora ATCC 74209]
YSPGLKPTEHMWNTLKEKAYELYPHLDLVSQSEEDGCTIVEAVKDFWRQLDQSLIHKHIDTMEHWIKTVMKARSWKRILKYTLLFG